MAVTKSLSGKCFQLFPWENTGLDQTKLIIIFEIPEPKGQKVHKASYKYKQGKQGKFRSVGKGGKSPDIEGEGKI